MSRARQGRDEQRDAARVELRKAADRRDPLGIRRAARAGAEVDFVELDGESALMSLAGRSSGLECVLALLELGADIEQEGADGRTPLICAIRRGHPKNALELIRRGADVNHEDWEGRSPLRWALLTRSGELAARLLEAGARASEADVDGESLAQAALRSGSKIALEVFKSARAQGEPARADLLFLIAEEAEESEQTEELLGWALDWAGAGALSARRADGLAPHEAARRARGADSPVSARLLAAHEKEELAGGLAGSAHGPGAKGARL